MGRTTCDHGQMASEPHVTVSGDLVGEHVVTSSDNGRTLANRHDAGSTRTPPDGAIWTLPPRMTQRLPRRRQRAFARYLWPVLTSTRWWLTRFVTATLSRVTRIIVPSHRSSVSHSVPCTAPAA